MQYTAIPNKQRALPAIFTNHFYKDEAVFSFADFYYLVAQT